MLLSFVSWYKRNDNARNIAYVDRKKYYITCPLFCFKFVYVIEYTDIVNNRTGQELSNSIVKNIATFRLMMMLYMKLAYNLINSTQNFFHCVLDILFILVFWREMHSFKHWKMSRLQKCKHIKYFQLRIHQIGDVYKHIVVRE